MAILEDRYRRDVLALRRLYKGDHAAYKIEFRKLWEQMEASLFRRDGKLSIIYKFQKKFAFRYFNLVKSFYDGEIDDETYRRRRKKALRQYAEEMFEVGLVTAVYDDAWAADFVRNSLAHERNILPVHTNGFSDEDADLLCDPLRTFSKRFFRKVHVDFGVPRLAASPEIYGGVDSDLCAAEEAASRAERVAP